MNKYGITINNHSEHIQFASSSHTAVDREMSRHIEGEFKPCATIKVRFLGKADKTWHVVAEVPFDYGDNGQGYSRTTVAEGFATEEEAKAEMLKIGNAHTDYKRMWVGSKYRKP